MDERIKKSKGRPKRIDSTKTFETFKQTNERKDKITAYMATFPSREENVAKAIKSLINQVDELVLWVNGNVILPDICNNKKIRVYRGEEILGFDIGCAGKFALAYEWNGYIFTVDDDIIYPNDYVEKSIVKLEEYNRQYVMSWHGRIQELPAIAYRGRGAVLKNCSFQTDVEKDTECNIIGTGCTFFHTDTIIPKYDIMEMNFSNVSDILFSISIDKRDIKRLVPAHKKDMFISLENTEAICFHRTNERFHIDLINTQNWIPCHL